jgi:transposase-like protein
MMSKQRISYSSSFKAKAALAAVRQEKTISQLSSQFHVHPNLIGKWKVLLLDNMEILFRDGRQKKPKDDVDVNELYSKIDRLEMENDFLKKKSAEIS